MNIREIISEGISPVVYHFTNVKVAKSILASGEFVLTPAGDEYEKKFQKGRKYFLSTARTRRGSYGVDNNLPVYFVLDGRKLSQLYKGHSIDYWYHEGSDKGGSEQEDRIVTNKRIIPAPPYVMGICVYIGRSSNGEAESDMHGLQIEYHRLRTNIDNILGGIELAEGAGDIPVRLYDNWGFYIHGNRKTISIDEAREMAAAAEAEISRIDKMLSNLRVDPNMEHRLEYMFSGSIPSTSVYFKGKAIDGKVSYSTAKLIGGVGTTYYISYNKGDGLYVYLGGNGGEFGVTCPDDMIKVVAGVIKRHESSKCAGDECKGATKRLYNELVKNGCEPSGVLQTH